MLPLGLKTFIVRLRILRTKFRKENQPVHFSFLLARSSRGRMITKNHGLSLLLRMSLPLEFVTLELKQLRMTTVTKSSQICLFDDDS